MQRLASAALLAFACTSAVHAQDAPPTTAPTLQVVHCGQLFDAASGRMRGETSIVVRGARIESVQAGAMGLPANATVIELGSATCVPGLIDAHTHLTFETSPTGFTDQFRLNAADYAVRSTVYARRTLQAGFTTVRNLGDGSGESIALRNAINAGLRSAS